LLRPHSRPELFQAEPVPVDIYLNVAVSGLLTGLVYGLMALGLSVIFGVVRVVNFAHGEMMTIAMYLAIVLFSAFKLDPLVMMVPIAGVLFALGYVMQAGLINPFVDRPEHSQFMLLVAVAIIMVNVLLLLFGPDARSVQTSYAFDSFAFGRIIVDATKVYAAGAAIVVSAALFAFFKFSMSARRSAPAPTITPGARRRPRREAALCADLRAGRGLRRRGRLDAGADHRRDAAARTAIHAACVCDRHRRRARLDAGRAARRRADRHDRGARRPAVHARRRKSMFAFAILGAGAAVPPAGNHGEARVMIARPDPRRAKDADGFCSPCS
jgi:hypothetical protein